MTEGDVSRASGQSGPTRVKAAPANALDAAWDALGGVYDPELCLDVVSLASSTTFAPRTACSSSR